MTASSRKPTGTLALAQRQTTTFRANLQSEIARREAIDYDRAGIAEAERSVEASRARSQRLVDFVREAWHVVEPKARYVHNWHIDAVCEHLEAVTEGRINRLLINVPPGSTKSLIVSVLWPAWEWGPKGQRTLRYLSTAYNDGPSTRDTRKMRDLVLSAWYQERWPEVRLVRAGETSFANSATGSREGLAFKSLTGQRGDRLIVDDPHSTETAESPAERARTTRLFREGATDRLNDIERSAIVVIMQRLHTDDVAGTILKLMGGDYVHLNLPMEFEVSRRCATRIGFEDPRTYEGELLDPVRFPAAEIAKLKKAKGPHAWASQYQQRPAPREGALFKVAMIEKVKRDKLPAGGFVRMCRAWDLAASVPVAGTDPDWTAGVLIGRDRDGFIWILDCARDRTTSHAVRQMMRSTASQDGPNCTIRFPQDPGQAGKDQAASISRALAGYPLSFKPVTGDKVTRAEPAADQVEAGNVRMLEGDWNDAFLEELRVFPAGSHDDQVDAFADAVNEVCDVGSWAGMAEFMRQEAEKVEAERSEPDRSVVDETFWRLRPPAEIREAYGRDGTRYTKGGDGVMTVHPDDAPAFLSQMGWTRVFELEGAAAGG